MEKFENLKEFRDLDSLKLINEDKSTEKLNDKFKDLQEIYTLIRTNIKNNGKQWIYSQKDEIFYIFSQNKFTTLAFYSERLYTTDKEKLKEISNKIKDHKIEFNVPNNNELENLNRIGFLGSGQWYCLDNNGNYYSRYWNYSSSHYALGICSINDFKDDLDIRNQSFKLETNILKEIDKKIIENGIEVEKYIYTDYFIEILSKIGICNIDDVRNLLARMQKDDNEVSPKEFLERYKVTLLESKELKDFEVILNYNLLDTDIIKGEEEQIKFRNLVNLYKTYKDYISCMYIKDDTEDTVELIFNADKIISSAENRDELFNGIEILYKKNKLGITKEEIYNDKNIFYFENGDAETIYDSRAEERTSMYHFSNGDEEKRIYKNGVLQGEAIFKKDNKVKKYFYTDGIREEMPTLKYYLSIDKERINIDDYDEERLWDINLGHWDLKEEDKEELKEILGKKVYERDPKEDVHQGGIVGIDFGTKSTVVVYQKDKTTIMPMRISGGKLNKKVDDTDYENPTVIEFRNVEKFLEKYNEKDGRPNTRWEDVMVSHTAFGNLTNGPSEYFTSIISDIKQWTTKEKEKHYLKDRTGSEYTLAPYLKLDENEENYIDPVEIYAYYIGSYINTMTNGIYLEYLLSFPVTYEKAIREKILKSFEKGIKKSLPIQIQEDEKLMKKFKVKHGANEPAAYAACALKNFKIEPKDKDDKVYYGVFDFGGGTTDFDFGIWKLAEDEDKYDYELEHFGAGGDKYLGGENIIKELAYKVFTENSDTLLKKRIQYIRPEGYDELKGEGALVNNDSSIAKLNTRILGEMLRGIWENSAIEDMKTIKLSYLYDTHGEKRGMGGDEELSFNVSEEKLKDFIKEKIAKGINNFFIKLEDAFKDEDAKEINIFLAGNSCKHPFVNEIFAEYQEKMKDKIKLNLYDLKAIEGLKEKDSTKVMPTGKTGVAYGLIYSRKGGRIKVTNRDEKENMANEVNFKFYIGNNKRDLFNSVLNPNSKYEKYEYFGKVTSDTFEIYYTTLPEAQTGKMEIDKTNVKRISLNEEYDEDEEYRIYIKATKPTKISYAIVKKEEDVDTKEFLEEGEIVLS
ncbi:hypothetical protein [Fusobacterium periodonticum]|uniref:Molecular chaperone DnaK n=2 Tax=Fusobacterium periodonticum TaxID=860 RepID=A0AAD0HW28_9FUSO|nr:hypothetical protein [Fusobacterium periodonticum]AVQ25964.1 hypothetical protein C4N17_10115 [Fusobacterium periodonticum]KGE61662.1 hypothetical protein FSAG_002254 [Fusobacterium periodonticum 2_1_31]